MMPDPHPCAIYEGNPKRPHQWRAAIASDRPGQPTVIHWRSAELHRTSEAAISEATQHFHQPKGATQ